MDWWQKSSDIATDTIAENDDDVTDINTGRALHTGIRRSISIGRSKSKSFTEMSTKRRLSVSVGRRLSTTIGWKTLGAGGISGSLSSTAAAQATTIAEEAKALCARYIRARFRRSGIFGHRKLDGLRRLRSAVNLTSANCNDFGGQSSREIFESIDLLGQTLESRHPKTYASVCRQIYRMLTSEEAAVDVFESVAHELIASNVTWGRVVALFAIAGALSVDCVHQGHVDYVLAIIDGFRDFVERELAPWIIQQGGWCALVTMVRPEYSGSGLPIVGLLLGVLVVALFLYVSIKLLLLKEVT